MLLKVWFPVAVLVSMLVVQHCFADMIKYTDKNGTLCFVDDLSKVPKRYRKNVIREHSESTVQVTDVTKKSSSGSTANTANDKVIVCFGSSGVDRINGRDITDFLVARDYLYGTRDVRNNPDNALSCAGLWCRLHLKDDSSSCFSKIAKDIEKHVPFTAVGNELWTSTDTWVHKNLDMHFHVDPNSRVIWKE